MGQSFYEIIEGNNNEASAKLRETALHPKTVVDASSLGQLGDAIKSRVTSRNSVATHRLARLASITTSTAKVTLCGFV
jgi:hypothetical protein